MAITRAKNNLSASPAHILTLPFSELRFFSDNYEQIEGECYFCLKPIVPDSRGPREPKY
jgi:hypothetical protein